MPNAARLVVLPQLREAHQITQSDMALYFGLTGRNARITMSRWENGQETPAIRHRARFINYLVDKLELRNDEERFNQVWQILSEEWGWLPLTENERRQCGFTTTSLVDNLAKLAPEDLEKRLNNPNPEVAASSIKAACRLVEEGDLPIEFLTKVSNHSYWLVRKIAIEFIVNKDVAQTLDLLHSFRNTSYHVSQKLIRDYIRRELSKNNLQSHQGKLAIEILEQLMQAPKVSDKSKAKDAELLGEVRRALDGVS